MFGSNIARKAPSPSDTLFPRTNVMDMETVAVCLNDTSRGLVADWGIWAEREESVRNDACVVV